MIDTSSVGGSAVAIGMWGKREEPTDGTTEATLQHKGGGCACARAPQVGKTLVLSIPLFLNTGISSLVETITSLQKEIRGNVWGRTAHPAPRSRPGRFSSDTKRLPCTRISAWLHPQSFFGSLLAPTPRALTAPTQG